MQSTNIYQIKAAIRDQAFIGNTRVSCPIGNIVAIRRRRGQILALIRGWVAGTRSRVCGLSTLAASSSRKGADPMKERLHHLLSEVGESFDYLRSDVRNLSRYLAELEKLVEGYRAFASNVTLSAQTDRATRHKLLKQTEKVLEPLPGKPQVDINLHDA
jgi:hypothetical protein